MTSPVLTPEQMRDWLAKMPTDSVYNNDFTPDPFSSWVQDDDESEFSQKKLETRIPTNATWRELETALESFLGDYLEKNAPVGVSVDMMKREIGKCWAALERPLVVKKVRSDEPPSISAGNVQGPYKVNGKITGTWRVVNLAEGHIDLERDKGERATLNVSSSGFRVGDLVEIS